MPIDLPLTSPEEAARYRRLGLWRDVTITDCFLAAAVSFPDKTAIVETARRYTYGEFRALVDNVAGNLLDLGLQPGQVVALQSKNAAEIPLLHLACNRIGLLFMPLHDSWRTVEVQHLMARARVPVLIIPKEYRGFDHAAMVQEIRPHLPELQHVFLLDGAAEGFLSFAQLTRPTTRSAADLDKYRPDPDLPAAIMLSGGTTSLSKISRFSSNDLLVMLEKFTDGIEFSPDDIGAALAPAGTGATGYVFPILTPLLHGATSIILERWGDPEEAVDLIRQHVCTFAVGIPTQLTRMIPALEKLSPADFPHFRCFFNSGAAMPYDTAAKIEALMNCKIMSMYGTTDGGVPVCTTVRDPKEKRLGTVGRVTRGCECQLWHPDGTQVGPGESGEVVWRGADKSWGYLGDDEQTAAVFTPDHFYKSGDLGQFDAEGYLRITGRAKDMILRGGRNIFPRTIEELLIRHPAVVDVSVAGMPDPELGERACAFVVLRAGASLGFEEMVEFLKGHSVAVWQLPERLELLDDLPRGPGGKVTKATLTAMVTAKLKAEGKVPA